jgi:hypothetical protein
MFLIEADYATKYTASDYTLDVKGDIGLTDDDLSQMYQYTKDIVTYNGKLKAVSWQATPGLYAYRRDLPKTFLAMMIRQRFRPRSPIGPSSMRSPLRRKPKASICSRAMMMPIVSIRTT